MVDLSRHPRRIRVGRNRALPGYRDDRGERHAAGTMDRLVLRNARLDAERLDRPHDRRVAWGQPGAKHFGTRVPGSFAGPEKPGRHRRRGTANGAGGPVHGGEYGYGRRRRLRTSVPCREFPGDGPRHVRAHHAGRSLARGMARACACERGALCSRRSALARAGFRPATARFAAAQARAIIVGAADGRIRVLTWNVHSCIGTDRRFDPERVKSVIKVIDPDIAALQEVDSRRDLRDGFDLLGNTLGSHSAEGRTVRTPDRDYGHMLLSRWKIASWTHHDLSYARREPRSVIEAKIETKAGPVSFLAAHLGLSHGERRQQAHTIAALADADGLPTVILGDFN